MSELGVGFGAQAQEQPEPEPEPEPAGPELPFEVVPVEGAELFGHKVMYTPNKKTGKLDLEGFAMSNPGVLEEGAKLVGVAFEAIGTFAKKAAAAASQPGVGAPAQISQAAGVGSAPAQVVDSIPDAARDATAGAGAFPAV